MTSLASGEGYGSMDRREERRCPARSRRGTHAVMVALIIVVVIVVVVWLVCSLYGKRIANKVAGSTRFPSTVTATCLGTKGQLGNQLYQVAAAVGIARDNKCEVVLPEGVKDTNVGRLCDLEGIKLATLKPNVMIKEKKEGFFIPVKIPDDGRVYDVEGYFQSHLYTERCVAEIRKILKPKRVHLENARKKVPACVRNNSIGVHVRRGDYMKEPHVHQYTHCTPEYYRNGVDSIRAANGRECVAVVCSDDIGWCKENLRIPEPVVFAETGSLYEDFAVLYHCQHTVMANSSFSLWSAYLKPDEEEIDVLSTKESENKPSIKRKIRRRSVVAPHPWYQVDGNLSHLNSDDIYRPTWTVLDANSTVITSQTPYHSQMRYVPKRVDDLARLADSRTGLVEDGSGRDGFTSKQLQLYGEAYVVSLNTAGERWKSAKEVLQRAGIRAYHFTAIDKPLIAGMGGRDGLKRLGFIEQDDSNLDNEGTIGCGLSHYAIWARALRNGLDRVTVFEDDIASYAGEMELDRKVKLAMEGMDEDWDFCFLGKCIDRCELYTRVAEGVYRTSRPYCTHAYTISARGMSKMLSRALYTGPDTQIIAAIQSGYVKAYVLHPSVFVQDIVRWSSSLRSYKLQVGNQNDCEYIKD